MNYRVVILETGGFYLRPETRREGEARLVRETIEGNARRAEALERPNRRTT